MPDIPLAAGVLADPTCWPSTPQALYEEMFEKGAAVMPEIVGLLIQDAVPAPEERNQGWIPTSGGVPIYPGYVFVWHSVLGHWVSQHRVPASDKRIEIFTGTSAEVTTLDGGLAGPVLPASGPFWEIYSAFEGRVPVGVGTIPTSAPAASITNPLDTSDSLGNSGEYEHVLTKAEGAVSDNVFPFGLTNQDPVSTADDAFFNFTGNPPTAVANWTGYYVTGNGSQTTAPETTANLYTLQADDGAGIPEIGHNNMQPWIGVYFIRRTARIWIVAA